jgi:hypothetical protein
MANPLDNHQTLHTLRKVIAAQDYNRVRLALSRISNPLQLELSNMKCLDIILNDHYWLCIDSCMGDRPIVAWTEFEDSDRSALNAPVPCELRVYHVHGALVMGEIIENLGQALQQRLDSLHT